jgi:Domain of unknown function (DUF1824)
MFSQSSSPLDKEAALEILRQFLCVELGSASPELNHETIREALQFVADHSDYQILGICADDIAQGQQALHQYLAALGRSERPDVIQMDGTIYIKYNPKTGRCHAEPYTGTHRGVLVSCQSAYDDDINETFGHLPLDLFG